MRQRFVPLTIAAFLLLGLIVYRVSASYGYTINNLLRTTRIGLELYHGNRERFVLTAGDSVPIDACISDGVEMYLLVHDCSRWHPRLFHWDVSDDRVVRLENRKLYGITPGRFTVRVRAMGHSDSLSGEILEPVSLTLSTYDTTLHVGDEIVVGAAVRSPTGGTPRIESVGFYEPYPNTTITWQEPLEWAYPNGMRLLARGPGVTCLGLTGYNKITWLRVAVVDNHGMARYDGKAVDPKRLVCGEPAIDHAVPQPTERAGPPVSALADSDIAAGARKAFAFERCMTREQEKGDTGRANRSGPALRLCADSVARLAPEWSLTRRSEEGISAYSAWFTHILSTDSSERRQLHLSSSQGSLEMTEFRSGPKPIYGMRARLQGDEYLALLAARDCIQLYRTRHGKAAPSIDQLIDFARAVWLETMPASRPVHHCRAESLRFKPRGAAESRDSRVHESGTFGLRYSAESGTVVVRPVRYGETGVVSYAADESGHLFRTLENRDPRPGDAYMHPRDNYWVFPHSMDAGQ
jgi:hypothetical protein